MKVASPTTVPTLRAPAPAADEPAPTLRTLETVADAPVVTPEQAAQSVAAALSSAAEYVPPSGELDPTITFAAGDARASARLTTLFQKQVHEGAWTGGDAAYSKRLPDGRVVWVFGDSFVGGVQQDGRRADDPSRFVRNSLVVQDGTKLRTVTGGTPDKPADLAVPPGKPGHWYWPGDSVAREGTLHLFMTAMRPGADPFWGWQKAGTDVVEVDTNDFSVRRVTPVSDDGRISWGAAVLDQGDHTYIYGAEDDAQVKHAHVARTGRDAITGPWQYWDGKAWTSDAARSARLPVKVSNQFSVLEAKDGVRLITQDGFDPTIRSYAGASPVGPFSEPKDVATIPPQIRERHAYNALAHPAVSDPGKLVLSYNVGGMDFMSDHTSYKPRFLEVDAAAL